MLWHQFAAGLCYVLVTGALSHVLGEMLPREWFRFDRFPFRSAAWEKEGRIYEHLGIQKWKDAAPDMSKLMGKMFPKKVVGRPDSGQILRLMEETCVAEFVHLVLILLSPLLLHYVHGGFGLAFLLVYDLLGNLPFLLIQRYNRPKLLRIYRRMQLRAEKAKNGGNPK